jgi:hypothetical protein
VFDRQSLKGFWLNRIFDTCGRVQTFIFDGRNKKCSRVASINIKNSSL